VAAASIWVDADACPNVIKDIQANRNAFAGHLDTWLARRSLE
jgi:uncharacterized protein YaiI (UPF0178 family)